MKNTLLLFSLVLFGITSLFAQHPPENWYYQDPATSEYQGIAINKTYAELLKNKTSEPVIVAVIDSGVDAEHEDLADNMWVNTAEIPDNGIDDDKNGYIDDIHGWNFIGGPNGNVNADTYEATRLYKKYLDKFKDVDPLNLSKDDKKEYALFLTVKNEVESKFEGAKKNLERVEGSKLGIMSAIDAMEKVLGNQELTAENVGAVDAGENEALVMGKTVLMRMLEGGESIGTLSDIKTQANEQFAGGIDYYGNQVKYAYNIEFDPRDIVGDNYDDPNDRNYGNNNVEGPDALHGTHVAGIIGAVRNNDIGMDGVAANVRIMSIRAVPNGDERDKDVANAIRYAVDNGASIINMSFGKGYSWDKRAVDEAVHYATKKDVLLVHAAGNSNQNNDESNNFPHDSYEKPFGFWFWKKKKTSKTWVEVGALSYKKGDESVATFSNYGKEQVDVFAPGVEIYSPVPDNKYRYLQGTSMAAPVIAGSAAVLRSYFPSLTAEQVKNIIMKSSEKLDLQVKLPGDESKIVPFSSLSKSGGTVNVYKAVQMAQKTKGKKKIKKKNTKA